MTPKSMAGTLLCLFLLQNILFAQSRPEGKPSQSSNVMFGKVSPADFDLSAYKFDSGASAVVIADIGESHLGYTLGKFALLSTRFRRMKILDQKGYDAAKEEIRLISGWKMSTDLDDLKATTYNLENGKVEESKLDETSVFTDKINKNWISKKFSFPAVKKGSIIEYTYTIRSNYTLYVPNWEFQGKYPCIWSEYNITIPEYLQYIFLSQGYHPFFIKTSKDGYYKEWVTEYRWVMKDVPALSDESFMTTPGNHISRIEFQLSQLAFPRLLPVDVMGNWYTLSEKLLQSEYFGAALDRNNGWMDDEVKHLTKGISDSLEIVKRIYAYVRDSFSCTAHRGFETITPLKEVFKNRKGSEAEINLLLIAMLSHININTDPVILGTREHGYTSPIYPILSRFDYVICRAIIDSTAWYLDASQPWIGFGHLPGYCYNGHARVVNKVNPQPVFFNADTLKEQKTTFVVINNDEKGGITGGFQSTAGYIGSLKTREEVARKGEEEFFKSIREAYPPEFTLSDPQIESLKVREDRVKVTYSFSFKPAEGNVIYFSPMLGEGFKTNPFKSAERVFPVEMPSAVDDVYILNMAVPNGYTIDEIPKSAKVLLNDTDGFFEFVVEIDGQSIQMRSRIKLNKASFGPADYQTLRDFFAIVVKKQNEQIVFKKNK